MKIVILLLLLTANLCNAQWITKNDEEYVTLTLAVDPRASFVERGVNAVAELTLISHFGYVKAGIQMFPGLTGGYSEVSGGVGLNQKSAILGVQTRLYQGIRAGFNYRAPSGEYNSYQGPVFAIEGGVDFNVNRSLTIGGRFTNDWREDMKYSGADPKWVQSFFVVMTVRL